MEVWNPHAKIRQDLFGWCDVLAVHPGGETLGVQATSGGNVAERVQKLLASEELRTCLLAGWCAEVWGWRQIRKRGLTRQGKPRKGHDWEALRVEIVIPEGGTDPLAIY